MLRESENRMESLVIKEGGQCNSSESGKCANDAFLSHESDCQMCNVQ